MESAALHGHSRTRRLCSGIPQLERAADLVPATWQPPNATLLSRAPVSGTVERLTLAVPAPPGVTRFYLRGKVGD